MKRTNNIFLGILIVLLLNLRIFSASFAQTPQKMSYQAVIRNSSNVLVASANIGIRVSILQGTQAVFVETHLTSTNANGLVSIEIGNGTFVSGIAFSTIDWSTGIYSITTETDPAGGTNYTIIGTSQLLSVPYAMYAKTAENFTGVITELDPIFGAHVASGITSTNIVNWNMAFGWGDHVGLYRPISYVPTWSEITSTPFNLVSPLNNQLIKYNSTTSKWENWTPNFLTTYTETDPIWTDAIVNYYTKTNMQTSGASQLHFNNLTNKPTTLLGYGITDAMSTTHAANGITSTNITNWNTAFGWGNHAGLYRPISYVPAWSEITSMPFNFTTPLNNQLIKYNSITSKWENWSPNFLTSYSESDPIWTAAIVNYFTKTNMQTSGASQLHFNNLTNKPTTLLGYGITDAMSTTHVANGITNANIINWNEAYAWGPHAGLYRPISYLPAWSEISSNPFLFNSPTNNQLLKYNSVTSKWQNWTPNYLTSYTETDPIFALWNKSTGISISASQITDFQTNVTNNAEVLANTAKNSYPSADALKLAGIAAGAEVNVNADWNATSGDAQILNKPTSFGADGSETKVTAGTNIWVTGTGTTLSPYVINTSAGGGAVHYIGEIFGGGVVFYVDQTGSHGLICGMIDLSTSQAWSNVNATLIGVTAQSDWNGQANTNAIIGQTLHTASAAKLCDNYTNVDYGTGAFSDWYLPTIDDLSMLYNIKRIVNKAIDSDGNSATTTISKTNYWSSTELSNNMAWTFLFSYGGTYDDFKNATASVRAIRAF